MSNTIATKINRLVEGYLQDLTEYLIKELPDVPKDKIEALIQSFNGKEGKKMPRKTIDHFLAPQKLTLMLNYGPSSHALFGEQTKSLSESGVFRHLNEDKMIVKFNGNLAFGPGWLIIDKQRLHLVEEALEKEEAEFETIERADYERRVGGPIDDGSVKKESTKAGSSVW